MPIHYSIIVDVGSEKSVGEYPRKKKVREVVLQQVVPKLAKTNFKRFLTSNDANVYIKCSGKNFYICFASPDMKQRVCWGFLDEVDMESMKNGVFVASSKLKDLLAYYNNPMNDKIQRLQMEIDNVNEVQSENISKILKARTLIDDLVGDTERLDDQAQEFKRHTQKAKCCACVIC